MLILFAIGVVTGTILSFELGLLWPRFMEQWGEVFGFAFAIEGFAEEQPTKLAALEATDERAPAVDRARLLLGGCLLVLVVDEAIAGSPACR